MSCSGFGRGLLAGGLSAWVHPTAPRSGPRAFQSRVQQGPQPLPAGGQSRGRESPRYTGHGCLACLAMGTTWEKAGTSTQLRSEFHFWDLVVPHGIVHGLPLPHFIYPGHLASYCNSWLLSLSVGDRRISVPGSTLATVSSSSWVCTESPPYHVCEPFLAWVTLGYPGVHGRTTSVCHIFSRPASPYGQLLPSLCLLSSMNTNFTSI